MIESGIADWIEKDRSTEIAEEMVPDADIITWNRNQLTTRETYSATDKEAASLVKKVSSDVLISMRLTFAAYTIKHLVEIDREIVGGVPVLRGTRFKIARILAEIADGMTVSKLSREFDLDKEKVVDLLRAMAIKLDKPFF